MQYTRSSRGPFSPSETLLLMVMVIGRDMNRTRELSSGSLRFGTSQPPSGQAF